MDKARTIEVVREKYEKLLPVLTERGRRHWAAAEAMVLPRSGITWVAQATGLSRTTITTGIRELTQEPAAENPLDGPAWSRRPGGGRPRLSEADPTLLRDLEALVAPATRGDPQSPLLWTCKSTRNLADELHQQGHDLSHVSVAALLEELGYSLQAPRKTRELVTHPDRNAQFEHINRQVLACQRRGQPVISVDTKKKELVGDYDNGGQEWQPEGKPQKVRAKDFPDKQLGKVAPYGVYDISRNSGWVSVGITHDTAEFASQTIRRWWEEMGQPVYPKAKELLITADGGGSNGTRNRLWKVCLQRLADATGLTIRVCHFPPGTSKWNKIEHRMFCHITQNWRGRPLLSRAIIVNLIGSTTTRGGLQINAELDEGSYATGIKVSDAELAAVNLHKDDFHGEWNYRIKPI
jgi:transposase